MSALRALEILGATGIIAVSDDYPPKVTAIFEFFRDWYDTLGILPVESDEVVHNTRKSIEALELALRGWVMDGLKASYGDAIRYLENRSPQMVADWRGTARKTLGILDDLQAGDISRFSQLGHWFEIILREWGIFGKTFNWLSDPGKDKILMMERQNMIVRLRHAIAHPRRDDIRLDDCKIVQGYCADILRRTRA